MRRTTKAGLYVAASIFNAAVAAHDFKATYKDEEDGLLWQQTMPVTAKALGNSLAAQLAGAAAAEGIAITGFAGNAVGVLTGGMGHDLKVRPL